MGYPGNQTDLVSILDGNVATPPYPGRFFNKIVGSVAGLWTVKGQGLHKYVAVNGQLRSAVKSPGSTGELKEDADVVAACTVSGVTDAIGSSTSSTVDSVVITRNGTAVTPTTPPSFNGITVTYTEDVGALVAVLVNEHATELEEGDVVTFTLASDTDVIVTYTVRKDDLQLSAGYYQFEAESTYDIYIGVGEVVEGHFTSIDREANDTAAKCVAYMN